MQAIRGRTYVIESTVYTDKDQGVKADLTGATIKAMLKVNARDTDVNALVTKASGAGIVVTDAANGVCRTTFTAVDMNLPASYNLLYLEVVAKLSDGSFIGNGIDEVQIKGNVLKTLF